MSTTIPAALTSLAAKWPAPTPVFIGAPAQHQSSDFVCVAWGGPEGAAVTTVETPGSLEYGDTSEAYDVHCQLVAWQGDTNLTACIGRVYALHDVLWDALAADPTLGGVAMTAQIGATTLLLVQEDQGSQAILTTVVTVLAQRS